MKFKEIKTEGLERHFKVTIPSNIIEPQISSTLKDIAKTARVDGFRIGKVPSSIIEKKYSASARNDVISREVRKAVDQVIKDTKLDIVGTPSIDLSDFNEGQDVEFTLMVEVMPKVELPNFKEIKITKPVLEVSEKDISDRIDRLMPMYKNMNLGFADRKKGSKSVDGDKLMIDFEGSVDGVLFDGGKASNYGLVLGSKSFIPGFEDQLIGKKAGEEVIVKVKFPENYGAPNLAGKDAEFKVTIHNIMAPAELKIDDDFAKTMGHEDLAAYKESLKQDIITSYDDSIYITMKMKLFDSLESSLTFDAPKALFNNEYNALKNQIDNIEEDESMNGKSAEDLDKYCNRVALRRVKIGLLLSEYVKARNLQITNQDIKDAIIAEARQFPGREKEVVEYFSQNKHALQSLTGPLLENKAVKAIFESEVSIKEKKYSVEALEKMLDEEAKKEVV